MLCDFGKDSVRNKEREYSQASISHQANFIVRHFFPSRRGSDQSSKYLSRGEDQQARDLHNQ